MATNNTNHSEYRKLAEKILKGTITPAEEARFEKWYAGFNDEEVELEKSRYNSSENLQAGIFQAIAKKIYARRNKYFSPWRIASVALILICFSFGLSYYLADRSVLNSSNQTNQNEILPGGNFATLVLENGQTIELDELADGHEIEIDGSLLQKNKDGELKMSLLPSNADTQVSHISYNTISTPKGGTYKVILADGTNVWLNSSSVLRFPTVFNGKERRVELSGEGYFDVEKDRNKPFVVVSKGQEIQVLGTQFNVSAYSDEENIKTTLIEGSVSVSYKNQIRTIRPGEQSIINKNGLMEVANVDVAFVKAWKEGYFAFDKLSVEEAMNQISRWYNVPVSFEGPISNRELTGQISKKVNLSTIMEILEFNGMELEFENNSLIVKE